MTRKAFPLALVDGPADPAPCRPEFTLAEAAEYLCMSVRTLRNLMHLKQIEYIRYGRSIRFSRDALDRFIAKRTIAARD